MSMAQNAVTTLNSITDEQYRDTNWWDEVVRELAGYDDNNTAAADPTGKSDVVVFADGSRCELDGPNWVAKE